jgi:hypothetical protein
MDNWTFQEIIFSGIPSLNLKLSAQAEVIINLQKSDGSLVNFEDDGNQFKVTNGPINYIFMPDIDNYGGFTITCDISGVEVTLLNVYEAPDKFMEDVRVALKNYLQPVQFAYTAAAAGGKRMQRKQRKQHRTTRKSRPRSRK